LCKISCKNPHASLKYLQKSQGAYFLSDHSVVYTLAPSFVKIYLKMTILCCFSFFMNLVQKMYVLAHAHLKFGQNTAKYSRIAEIFNFFLGKIGRIINNSAIHCRTDVLKFDTLVHHAYRNWTIGATQVAIQLNCHLFSERELTFTFALCHRPSVCLSVCNVRAPYSGDWNFRQSVYAIWYVDHLLTSR